MAGAGRNSDDAPPWASTASRLILLHPQPPSPPAFTDPGLTHNLQRPPWKIYHNKRHHILAGSAPSPPETTMQTPKNCTKVGTNKQPADTQRETPPHPSSTPRMHEEASHSHPTYPAKTADGRQQSATDRDTDDDEEDEDEKEALLVQCAQLGHRRGVVMVRGGTWGGCSRSQVGAGGRGSRPAVYSAEHAGGRGEIGPLRWLLLRAISIILPLSLASI